jgi:hypothetical protein
MSLTYFISADTAQGIATGNTRGDRNSPPSGPVENPTPESKLSPESIAAVRILDSG